MHRWLAEHPRVDVYGSAFAWSYLALLSVPLVTAAGLRSMPLFQYGVCRPAPARWREAGVLIFLGLGVLSLLGDISFPETWATPSLRSFGVLRFLPVSLSYLLHAGMQEFLRVVLLRILQEELGDLRGRGSAVLCAALFAASHLHFGWAGAGVVFALSTALGLLFLRQASIFPVALIHGVLGLAVFAIQWI